MLMQNCCSKFSNQSIIMSSYSLKGHRKPQGAVLVKMLIPCPCAAPVLFGQGGQLTPQPPPPNILKKRCDNFNLLVIIICTLYTVLTTVLLGYLATAINARSTFMNATLCS